MENKEDIAAALAAGGEIEYMNKNGEWHVAREYRVKPKRPEYPASTISDAQLLEHWQTSFSTLRGVADAAVRYEFEVGNAIPKAEHEAALATCLLDFSPAKRAARDLAIAEAVQLAALAALIGARVPSIERDCVLRLDLPAVVDGVK